MNFRTVKIVDNPEETTLTSQQETTKGRGKRKRQSTEHAMESEGSKKTTTKGRKQVNRDISFLSFILDNG
jgi:hypothetical protein